MGDFGGKTGPLKGGKITIFCDIGDFVGGFQKKGWRLAESFGLHVPNG